MKRSTLSVVTGYSLMNVDKYQMIKLIYILYKILRLFVTWTFLLCIVHNIKYSNYDVHGTVLMIND